MSIALILFATVAAATPSSPPPPNDTTFGYLDATGARLIVVGERSTTRYTHAVCGTSGRSLDLRYRAYQSPAVTAARQTPKEFDHQAGEIYALAIPFQDLAGETCSLRTDAAVAHHVTNVLHVKPTCSDSTLQRLAAHGKRKIVGCWRLATIDGTDGEIITASYAKTGKQSLATIAYVNASTLVAHDFPAECEGRESCWRVDDDGKWTPESLAVITTYDGKKLPRIALTMSGAEGENAELFDVARANAPTVLEVYRYWSPE